MVNNFDIGDGLEMFFFGLVGDEEGDDCFWCLSMIKDIIISVMVVIDLMMGVVI